MKRHKTQRGFTLIETLVVIAIVAILLGIAVPSYTYITNSYRMTGEVNGLLGDAQFARSEAIKEGNQVILCSSTNGTSCAGVTTWQLGWIVCVDLKNERQLRCRRPGAADTGDLGQYRHLRVRQRHRHHIQP